MLKIDYSNKIASLRKAKGLTRKELCTISGICVPALCRLENAHSDFRVSTLLRLCDGLGVNPSEFLKVSKNGK